MRAVCAVLLDDLAEQYVCLRQHHHRHVRHCQCANFSIATGDFSFMKLLQERYQVCDLLLTKMCHSVDHCTVTSLSNTHSIFSVWLQISVCNISMQIFCC